MFRILAEIVLRLTFKHKNVKTLGEIKFFLFVAAFTNDITF